MKAKLTTLLRVFATFIVIATPALAAADEFVDVTPQNTPPSFSAPLFVIIAYAAIWIVVTLFTLILFRQQRAVRDELAYAQERLDALEETHDEAPRAS